MRTGTRIVFITLRAMKSITRSVMNTLGPDDGRLTRRGWCSASARSLALGGIAWLSVEVLRRPEGCRREAIACRDCAALGECRLPQALAAKPGNKVPRKNKLDKLIGPKEA